MTCEARQHSDEMICGRCGLTWAVDDPDPPPCKRATDRRAIPDRRVTKEALRADGRFVFHPGGAGELAAMRTNPDRRFVATVTAQVPVELLDPLALELAEAYEQARGRGLGGVDAMRVAYRLLLDRLP